jgi:hypothetical protein
MTASPDPYSQPRAYLARADFRQRVKKGPENPISVVADKAAARGANPAHDRSFYQRGVLAAGRHARIRLPVGTGR